jgi:hypothetical protein
MWHTWSRRKSYRISVGKTRRKETIEKPWWRWQDNIKMELKGKE